VAVIHLENVSRSFGSVVAVADVSLEIARGETVGLVGTSGCGKTTTLRLINRLVEPTGGRVSVEGRDVGELDPVRLRRGMGYVIQSGGLFPHMSVADNVTLLARLEGWEGPRIESRFEELLGMAHLTEDLAGRYPGELSGGQRQRVGVARALMLDPPILLMDEPFGALDPMTRAGVQDEFLELKHTMAKTIVLVTHDLDEAFRLCDRVALMGEGRLLQVGTREDFRADPRTDDVRRFMERHLA